MSRHRSYAKAWRAQPTFRRCILAAAYLWGASTLLLAPGRARALEYTYIDAGSSTRWEIDGSNYIRAVAFNGLAQIAFARSLRLRGSAEVW